MPTILQFRRGTDSQHSSYTGASGEITFDTTNNTIRAHDGSTAGGHRIATYAEMLVAGLDSSQIFSLIDSNYIGQRQAGVDLTPYATISYVDTELATIDSAYIQARVTEPFLETIIDSAYVQARQVDFFRDSAFVTDIVDTVYIQTRDRIRDSAFVTDIVDQAYIQARDRFRDSGFVEVIVDSAYVAARTSGGTAGAIGSPTDGSLTDGAINTYHPEYLTSTSSVADGIDYLNEALLNVANNTFVSAVSFSGSPTAGGEGTNVTLTLNVTGNANRYDIYWGDGTIDSATSDNTPSHTYASNSGSPYTVRVRAFNNSGSGVGSEVSTQRDDYIIIYTADPVVAFRLYRTSSGGSPLSGNDLYVIEGNDLYFENITSNTTSGDAWYSVDWGDGSSTDLIVGDAASGGVNGSRLQHTWSLGTSSGTGRDTIQLSLDSHTTADPSILPLSQTELLKIYDPNISSPDGLSSKTISLGFSSTGTSPLLASGFTDNTGGASLTAGSSVTRTTNSGTLETAVLSTYAYDASSGSLSAIVDGSADGVIALDANDNTGTNGSLVLTDEEDYNLLNASGSTVSFATSIYHPTLFTGFKAKISKSSLSTGVHSYQLSHSSTGSTNTLEFVKDDLITSPSISSSGTLSENNAGTYRYISGIPYYNTGSPTLSLTGVQVSNLVGQCYLNQNNIVEVDAGTNFEGTSSTSVSNSDFNYSQIDGASSMLTGGIPNVNIGVSSPYTLGSFTIPITSSSVRTVEQIQVRARNVNGNSSYSAISGKIQVHTAPQSGISEVEISVSNSLGGTYTDNGVRIFDFNASTTNNPTYNSATNFYTNNPYTESSDPGVAGTKEATVRIGQIKHDVTNYSTGFLPVGPDRSGDTGTQYFTFAFRRSAVSSFNINIISSGVAGVWIAAPGTAIDNTSDINGWLDCSLQYNGAGVPGADTGNGGNGSNGCASTGGDIISSNTSLSGSYTMTLGTENLSNATNNVALVRIALSSGQSVTSLSIS